MRVFAAVNQKGGSGKTTTAVNLGAALAEKGRRVLVLDLDPQASASAWLGVKDGGKGLLEVFTQGAALAPLVKPTAVPNLEVVPSSSWLLGVERALAGEPGAETILRRAIAKLPGRWDYVLLDCPPTLGLLAVSALTAADEVLVPVEAHVMALAGLASLTQTVDLVRDRLNPELAIGAILACRVDMRTNLSREVVGSLRDRFKGLVLKTVVRENVRLAEAPSFSQPITTYAPESAGAEDYRSAAAEILSRGKRRSAHA